MADQITTPQTSTGIMRFYDVNASKFQLDPRIVMGFAIFVVLAEIALSMFS